MPTPAPPQSPMARLKSLAHRGMQFFELDHSRTHGPTPQPLSRSSAGLDPDPVLVPAPVAAGPQGTGSLVMPAIAPPSAAALAPDSDEAAPPISSLRQYQDEVTARVERLAQHASGVVAEFSAALIQDSLRDATPLQDVADQYLSELSGDGDQVVAQTLAKRADRDLALRSVQMSVLSMAVCRAMAMPESDWMNAGVAAMLHDMGLFRLPETDRFPHPLMKPESRQVYEWHPVIAYDLLEKVRQIDGSVRLVALQTHEQADGSGFPRHLTLPRIHRLARVLNVVDAYIRLVGCGCDGQRIYPADAMAYLMHHSCAGRFDPEVTCGLVKVVSLYPIGSQVMLSNTKQARVLRANPAQPFKPVVLVDGENQLVDLATSNLVVEAPQDDIDSGRRRLPSGEFDHILW